MVSTYGWRGDFETQNEGDSAKELYYTPDIHVAISLYSGDKTGRIASKVSTHSFSNYTGDWSYHHRACASTINLPEETVATLIGPC